MPDITSSHNPRLKAATKLRESRERRRAGCFLIDGVREITRALEAGIVVEEAFVNADAEGALIAPLVTRLRDAGAEILITASASFERVAFGERDEGIVVVAQSPNVTLDTLKLPNDPLIAVLEGVEKPGNVGAVLRTADAASISAVIVADGGTDLYNPNAIRASLGAIFTVPICAATADETLEWLIARRFAIFAAQVDAEASYTAVSYRGPAALVLGSESQGLSSVWRNPAVTPIALPMRGVVDSLNVSVTAAILFYEALRQRCTQ